MIVEGTKIDIDYSFYKGKDIYTDGDIEDYLLKVCKEQRQEEVLHNSTQWPILYHLSDIRENILEWYNITKNDEVLEVGSGCGAITGLLSKKAKSVTCIELSEKRSMINAYKNNKCDNVKIYLGNFEDVVIDKKYDLITLIGVWEYAGLYVSGENPYIKMLSRLKNCLKKNGKIIIAIENKMGLKYWNGAVEDHNGEIFGGLNDYIGSKNIRTFSKQEIEEMLKDVGFEASQFYYPMADYKLPDVIYTDEFLPNTGNLRYYKCDYSNPRVYNFNEATVCDQLCRDEMFSYFANSFLIVCGEEVKKIIFAKYNRERKEKFRISTKIIQQERGRKVVKQALNDNAIEHIFKIKENEKLLSNSIQSVKFVCGEMVGNSYQLDFIEGMDIDSYLYQWRNEKERLIEEIKKVLSKYYFFDNNELIDFEITDEFKKVFGNLYPINCKSLKVTNVDMIFSNIKILNDNQVYCFDNEWVFDFPIPHDFILWRTLIDFYEKFLVYIKQNFSRKEFVSCFNISNEDYEIYSNMELNFNKYVYGNQQFYLENYRKIAISNKILWN